MQIQLICVGTRMPDWVQAGYENYARRLPHECALQLIEIPTGQRRKGGSVERAVQQEGERMLAAAKTIRHLIALDERGRLWNTQQLAQQLATWLAEGQNLALLVGGPDGLAADCRAQARQHWSLSPLTLPHALVRILVAEQIYRAWSLLKGHPYHRA